MKNALISVIIPIYNVEKFIFEAINSICKQTYKNLEIILVDDGSTDNSSNICDEISSKDKRIKTIHKKNGGLSSARNAGIDIATGEYIFFLDGDDFIELNTLEILISYFNFKNNLGIVSAPCFYRYNNGLTTIFREDWNIKDVRIISYEDFCVMGLKQEFCFSACCKLYKKTLFDTLRFREGKKNEDTLFTFDVSFIMRKKKLNMLEVPFKLYYYRETPNSISRNITRPIQIDYIENLQSMLNETIDTKVKKVLTEIYYNEIISFMSWTLTIPVNMRPDNQHLNTCSNYFNKISIIELVKYTSIKNTLKYILISFFKPLYLIFFRIKRSLFIFLHK